MGESSLLNSFINCLPFELHLPGYNFCGPGTRLQYRLARGDKGINLLDEYCKHHDIAYQQSKSLKDRHIADIVLMKMAKKRASDPNAKLSEKIAAKIVNKAMLAKLSMGAGLKKKMTRKVTLKSGKGIKKHFNFIVNHAKKFLSKQKPKCKKAAIEFAIAAVKELACDDQTQQIKPPRIIPVPKTGGFIPLVPLFAGLSATGMLTGGATGIARAIQEFNSAKKRMQESKQHNKKLESLCIGNGLVLRSYKNGLGIQTMQKN